MPVDVRIQYKEDDDKLVGTLNCLECKNTFTSEKGIPKGADKKAIWKLMEVISDHLGQHRH